MVSEIMLQQTQVDRVRPKYIAFIKKFPTVKKLALATNHDVLSLWSGLGYNRRALFLKRAAETIIQNYGGKFPRDPETLETLPGIGPYTARAIATFCWNSPYTFIETNVRSVFIHSFHPRSKKVPDAKLLPLIERALPKKESREWYWALMDYGVYLKKTQPNPSRRSKTHVKQSKFQGSDRQIRGAVIKNMLANKKVTEKNLLRLLSMYETKRVLSVLSRLIAEQLLEQENGVYRIRN